MSPRGGGEQGQRREGMAKVTGFPTSSDIYLELEGKKVAVVQSYSVRTTKTSQVI